MNVSAIARAASAVVNATMLPDVCTLQTATEATDGAGGLTTVWAGVAAVPCQVSAVSAREAAVSDKLAEIADYQITLPAGTPVAATQRITHTVGVTTTTYVIVGVQASKTFDLARTVLVQVVS